MKNICFFMMPFLVTASCWAAEPLKAANPSHYDLSAKITELLADGIYNGKTLEGESCQVVVDTLLDPNPEKTEYVNVRLFSKKQSLGVELFFDNTDKSMSGSTQANQVIVTALKDSRFIVLVAQKLEDGILVALDMTSRFSSIKSHCKISF